MFRGQHRVRMLGSSVRHRALLAICELRHPQPRSEGSTHRWTTHPARPGTTSPVVTTS
jgi:hypothetical protein